MRLLRLKEMQRFLLKLQKKMEPVVSQLKDMVLVSSRHHSITRLSDDLLARIFKLAIVDAATLWPVGYI